MNKIKKALLVLVVLISLCACSSKQEKNELVSLYEQGYEPTQTSFQDGKWTALYQKDFNINDAYKVELSMDQETFDKLFEIDTFEQEGEKQFEEIVTNLLDCKITSLNDQVPSANEFDKYIGKTIQVLEDDGYERNGYIYDEEGCIFFMEGPKYSINVKSNEVITFETVDDYSENDIRALTIKSIELTGFSYRIFE